MNCARLSRWKPRLDRAEVTTVALTVPEPEDLFDALSRYGTFLRLEYPNHRWSDTEPAVASSSDPYPSGATF